jgi:hypothetical protein
MTELAEIAPAFVEMAHRVVWCVAATSGAAGEPRTRVLHPIWGWEDGALTGWIATGPSSFKARDLAANPRLSLTYWDATQDTCTADCDTSWDDTAELRAAGWARFKDGPAPVGYDPALIPGWTSPDAEAFGVLRLRPRRLALMDGSLMTRGEGRMFRWSA